MKIDPQQIVALLASSAAKVFEPCRIPGCAAHSLGFVCVGCSRYTCQRHTYLRATVPAQVLCISCLVEEHRELWAEPDDVVEAEIVE